MIIGEATNQRWVSNVKKNCYLDFWCNSSCYQVYSWFNLGAAKIKKSEVSLKFELNNTTHKNLQKNLPSTIQKIADLRCQKKLYSNPKLFDSIFVPWKTELYSSTSSRHCRRNHIIQEYPSTFAIFITIFST